MRESRTLGSLGAKPNGRATRPFPTGELRTLTDALNNTTTATHDQLGRVSNVVDALGRAHQKTYPAPNASQLVGALMLTGSASATPASTTMGSTPLSSGDYQIGGQIFDAFLVGDSTALQGDSFLAPGSTGVSTYGTRSVPQVTFYQDATIQVSYGRQFDDALRLQTKEDRSGLPFAGTTALSAGLSGGYVDQLQSWTPDLPIKALTTFESDYPGYYESSALTYGLYYDVATAQGFQTHPNQEQVSETYTRDAGGRIKTLSRRYLETQTFNAPLMTYTYEPSSDRLASTIDADGEHDFAYDIRGQVQSVTIPGEGTYVFGYDAVSRNITLQYPDGHMRVQQYDSEGRMVSRCYNYTNGAESRCYTAQYDAVGNPTTMTDPEGTDVIVYDNLYRVTQVTRQVSGQAAIVESYGYSAIGALNTNAPETTGTALNDQRPRIGGSGANDTAASPVMSAVNGVPVTVDPAGRVTSLAGATLNFDKQGLLRSVVTGNSTETYHYDTNLHRIGRDSGGTSEYYIYQGSNIIARVDGTAKVLESYVYEGVDAPLRVKFPSQPNDYYELDLAGNIRRLRDSTGADLGGFRYTALT